MSNPVVHFEFWSREPEKLAEFYQQAFDWDIQHMPEMNYRMVNTGEGLGGGIMQPDEGEMPGNMAVYLNTDDLAATRAKIQAAGGKIILEEQEIPGMGKMCLFADPDGRVNGVWQPMQGDAQG